MDGGLPTSSTTYHHPPKSQKDDGRKNIVRAKSVWRNKLLRLELSAQRLTFSMSSKSQTETLIATAIAAAAAGAAVAYAAVKSTEKKTTSSTRPKSIIIGQTVDPRVQSDILFPHNHEEKMRRRVAQRVVVEEENKTPRDSVTVRVPATSANVGPGCKSTLFGH